MRIETPVSAKVPGSISAVLVENGQMVKTGDPLVRLDDENYRLLFESANAQYEKGTISLQAIAKKVDQSQHNLKAAKSNLEILNNQYRQRNHPSVKGGVPQIEMTDLKHKIDAQSNVVASLADQYEIDQYELEMARANLISLKSTRDQSENALKDTVIRAQTDGQIQNVFLGIGKHVVPGEALFNLVNKAGVYVQANFEETDLDDVRAGDKATIYPRIYMGKKSFEGVVVSNPLGVSRRITQPMTGNQIVATENKWLLLPQRLPVIIKVTNPDDAYPLENGMSAYVRLRGQ